MGLITGFFAVAAYLIGLCGGVRRVPKLGRFGMSICTVTPPQSSRTAESTAIGATFLVLPEKSERAYQSDVGSLKVGDQQLNVVEGSNFSPGGGTLTAGGPAQTKHANTIHVVRNDYKIGLSELSNESIFDKRRNHVNLVELAKMALRADGIIVPLDYDTLIVKGQMLYQLQLLDVVLFILRQMGNLKLNFNFVVYNYKKDRGGDEARREFYERHEKEIAEVLSQLVKSETDVVDTCVTFTGASNPSDCLDAASAWISKRIELRQACRAEFENEALKKEELVDRMRTVQEFMNSSVNDVAGKLKGVDLTKDVRALHQLLESATAVELSVNKWMQENAMALSELPEKLKVQVDTLIATMLGQFDSRAQAVAAKNQAYRSMVRRSLVESLQNKLMFMMDSVVLKIQDTVMQEFQNSLQTLPVDENLDLNLQEAIGKYDRQWCSLVEQCKFDILKGSQLYRLKSLMQRKDMICSMKEVANHVLEYAISKGLFYAKFSILDGIAYVPSNAVTRFIAKWIHRLRIPLHITLNYLSPTAFGFSNLFRRFSLNFVAHLDTMGWHLQRYIAKAGRAINPLVWRRAWKENEGRQLNDVAAKIANDLNNEIAQVARVSQYRYWWWANPLGAGLICYGVYKFWYMSYMAHKQRTVAQIVAGAYGQGGQWLNPVPK
ncbi:ribosomal protein S15 domain-containing protein [Babesia caballi]|uniref:Ribosomal protein S15 domain-containing protein n=1 Tax=Babesia caballi TaxID=5871 RepID=A0AAV4LLX9_BABCB|nr:ribosomal protein S15 domain-containing protein [Babesia caballi]